MRNFLNIVIILTVLFFVIFYKPTGTADKEYIEKHRTAPVKNIDSTIQVYLK